MIHQLSSTTINQIAAGEIVVGPQNALKELLENSIDAKSTRIDVITKDGGVKLLQVTDNGTGIGQDDLELLCRRWCTSKIDTHDDLKTLTSYGFRGEALASISHVSHVTVITKTKTDPAASRAKYTLGEISEQTLQAGNTGTQITVQDLFFNTPQRLRALNKADCHTKCVDVVSRYGIHNEEVEFSFRRQNDSSMLFTLKGSRKDRIRVVYGSRVSGSLVEIGDDTETDESALKAIGLSSTPKMLISNPNYSNTKSTFIIFINNRLVSCEPIRKALVAVYSRYLPTKSFPFVYLSLFIDSENLDVNVHPTKQEVRFLHQAEIVEYLSNLVDDKLSNVDESRAFEVIDAKKVTSTNKTAAPSNSQMYAHSQNRTDYSQMHLPFKKVKLDEREESSDVKPRAPLDLSKFKSTQEDEDDSDGDADISRDCGNDTADLSIDFTQDPKAREYTQTRLKSVHTLYNNYTESHSASVTQIVKYHVFVGIVDPEKRLCCVQFELQLLLVDYARLSTDFFYQRTLQGFGNFGIFDLELDLEGVWSEEESQVLLQNKAMLAEYFKIGFEGNSLVSLPSLLPDYEPDCSKLGVFVKQLAQCNFENESKCFEEVSRVIANLFTLSVDQSAEVGKLMQRMRDQYIAHSSVEEGVVVVTSMPSLYKVFERC